MNTEPLFILLHRIVYEFPPKDHPPLEPLPDDASDSEKFERTMHLHRRSLDWYDYFAEPVIHRFPTVINVRSILEIEPTTWDGAEHRVEDTSILLSHNTRPVQFDETFDQVRNMLYPWGGFNGIRPSRAIIDNNDQ